MLGNLARMATRNITSTTLNPRVLNAQYAVRGELVTRAMGYAETLRKAKDNGEPHSLPFDVVIFSNIGNPAALGQSPISFPRQVMSCVVNPALIEASEKSGADTGIPSDVIVRAKKIIGSLSGNNVGAYSESAGFRYARESVARFIAERDGVEIPSADDIFLGNGASDGISKILTLVIRGETDGVMIPIPQYPLYSATISLLGGAQVPYYLDEEKSWGLDRAELERSYEKAKAEGILPRAFVLINPGNPTGQVMERADLETVVSFCAQRDLLLLSDEVYQPNIYADTPFVSAKKVATDMNAGIQLASFHSTSKGFLGECGFRGGYCEMHNFDPDVKKEVLKLASMFLCSNIPGQVMTQLMVDPPRPGEPSHDLYVKERDTILESLKRRAIKLRNSLCDMEGVTCNEATGAMYLFPQIRLPQRAIEAAKAEGKPADTFYCMKLLDATGICVVPGSGFQQKDGTYHFRTTFLPPEDQIDTFASKIGKFHADFLAQYN